MKFNVDLLNTFLIILSLILAFYLPLELFVIMYALLGPLHYLTEINWIYDKNYLTPNKVWVYLVVCFAIIFSFPKILSLPFFEAIFGENIVYQFFAFEIKKYVNGVLFLGIVVAFAFMTFKSKQYQIMVIAMGIILAILLYGNEAYNVFIGIFLPTIIHVFIFTLIFMLYGNLKTNNKIGYFNIILLTAIPFLIFSLSITPDSYHFSQNIKNIFIENKFHILNAYLSTFFGFTESLSFFFYEAIDIKIQMFIAFAYTYHYLNWFSKTTVIGWHKRLTIKNTLLIGFLWIFSVSLYVYDYKIGLAILLFLSVLHVIMEFPLNIISVKAIWQHIFNK